MGVENDKNSLRFFMSDLSLVRSTVQQWLSFERNMTGGATKEEIVDYKATLRVLDKVSEYYQFLMQHSIKAESNE